MAGSGNSFAVQTVSRFSWYCLYISASAVGERLRSSSSGVGGVFLGGDLAVVVGGRVGLVVSILRCVMFEVVLDRRVRSIIVFPVVYAGCGWGLY